MSRLRRNITLYDEVLARAQAVMKARAIDELSDFIATLIREEWDRRRAELAPVQTPMAAETAPPAAPQKKATVRMPGKYPKHRKEKMEMNETSKPGPKSKRTGANLSSDEKQ